MATLTRWSDLVLSDGDEEIPATDPRARRPLAEYRERGTMCDWYPATDEIDWTGFDA